MTGPLGGLRVLDLSRVLAGPWAAQTLADLGAEVVKIERPGSGDDTRGWGPPFVAGENGETGDAAYFLAANRGKKSVAIDLAAPRGQELVRALSPRFDVVVENFKTGGLKKYGLDYDSLKGLNAGLIYCSITGFGQTGPRAREPGYDLMIQGLGGLMSVTGEADGGPQKVGVAVADLMTGMYATVAILAALNHRQRTGEGQHIDLALLDSQVAMLASQNMNFLISGVAPGRMGNAHPNVTPYQVFATGDGHIIVAVGNDAQFARLAAALGQPGLASDQRFASNPARLKNRDELEEIMTTALAGKTSAQWLAALAEAGVPCGPINDLAQVFADPQVRHRGLRLDLPHGLAGTVPSVAGPIRYSATPLEYQSGPPVLGEHTDQVLAAELGLEEDELAALRADGIIG